MGGAGAGAMGGSTPMASWAAANPYVYGGGNNLYG